MTPPEQSEVETDKPRSVILVCDKCEVAPFEITTLIYPPIPKLIKWWCPDCGKINERDLSNPFPLSDG